MRFFDCVGRRALWLLTTAVALAMAAGAAPAADAIPAERRLPRDIVAYVSFRNVTELKTQWGLSQSGKMMNDEALADFRAAAGDKLTQFSAIAAEHLGLGITDLLEIPHGELAASLSVLPDGKLAGAMILDFGDKEDAVRKMLEKLNDRSSDEGLERSEDEFEDTKLTIYRKPAVAGAHAQPAMDAVAYFLKDSFLVVGNTPQTLKSILTRWDGTHDGVLAENPIYRYVTEGCRDATQDAAPLVNWFVDPLGIVRAAIASQPQNALQGSMVLAMFPALGLDKFKGVGGSFDMVRGDFDMVSRALVYMEPPVKGVLNVFQFAPGTQVPPKWVTADAETYFTIRWSIDKAYTAVEGLVDSFQGPGALVRLMQQLSENDELGNVHPKKDLIDLLTGKVHIVGAPSAVDEDEKYLVAAEVKNAATAKATLRKLSQAQGIQVKEREFQGETIYEIDLSADDEISAGVVVSDNHLMFASNVKLLEQVLRGSEGRELLVDLPDYKRIASRFPESTVGSSFARVNDPLESVRALFQLPFFMQDGDDSLEEKLPAPEAVKKYALPSGSYIVPDEKGLKIVSFTLKPSE